MVSAQAISSRKNRYAGLFGAASGLHESTRRNLIRAAFLLFALAPTVFSIALCLAYRSPRSQKELLAYLTDATGLKIDAASIQHPRPGIIRFVGFSANLPEENAVRAPAKDSGPPQPGETLASAVSVDVCNRGDWWEVSANSLKVSAASTTALHNLLVHQLARLRSTTSHRGWLLRAPHAELKAPEQVMQLERLTLGLSPFDATAHAWFKLEFSGKKEPMGCRLVQQLDSTWREIEVWTGDVEIPGSLLGILQPSWKPLGEPILFRGYAKAVREQDGWALVSGQVSSQGARRNATQAKSELRCPQGRAELGIVSGDVRLVLEEFSMRADRIQHLRGYIRCDEGEYEAVRLGRLIEQMEGWTPESIRIASAGTRVAFKRIAASLAIERGRFRLWGECPYPEPGVVMVGQDDRKLAASRKRDVSLLQLADALAPPGSVIMPVGKGQSWLQCLAPHETWMR